MTRDSSTIVIVLVTPGGVGTRWFADGAADMRVTMGHVEHPDGLLAEARSSREPTPWESRATRDEALERIAARKDLSDEERALLLAHVRRTPRYDASDPGSP